MSLRSVLSILCGLMLYGSLSASNTTLPQKIVSHHTDLKSFREDGIFDYSTMLIREDLDVLLLGATDAIFALDLNNISVKKSAVYWPAEEKRQSKCLNRKDKEQEQSKCRNYIRILHKLNETTMYVCGTNAFRSTCDYMTFVDGQLELKGEKEFQDYTCPSDPFQKSTSLMVGRDLFSARPYYAQKSNVPEDISDVVNVLYSGHWFRDPTFVHMEFVAESFDSQDGDDDRIYMFFSENDQEYTSKVVSRVARVCKGDLGGLAILANTWTSFLKARLDCSLSEASLPPIVQDVFLLKNDDWRNSVFYAVFTTQSSSSKTSFVCAYSVSAIRKVFNEGHFKTPDGKSVVPAGEVPVPRPGACINDVARNLGIMSSEDLSRGSLMFINQHPLIDEAVQPMTGGPLLVMKGLLLTQIVVERTMALDGQNYTVMFVGTENGFVNKAVNYDGQMFIIEEIQLHEDPVPISTLHLSQSKGQIYAGSQFGAVQMPVSNCGRYATCEDCVLAKDPYCAWDLATKQCSSVTGVSSTAVQSLMEGDFTQCPQLDPVTAVNVVLVPGNNIQLLCQAHSNLTQVHWRHSGQTLCPNDKYYFSDWGLVIVNTTTLDSGLYICDSVEKTVGRKYKRTVAAYELQLPPVGTTTTAATTTTDAATIAAATTTDTATTAAPTANTEKINKKVSILNTDNHSAEQRTTLIILVVSVILLALACIFLGLVLIWKFRRECFQSLEVAQSTDQSSGERQPDECTDTQNRSSGSSCHRLQDMKPLSSIDTDSANYPRGDGDQFLNQMPISALHGPDSVNETVI